jgi:hypothetical protein
MGRGLSDLQKAILRLARDKRAVGGWDEERYQDWVNKPWETVTWSEILATIYGFPGYLPRESSSDREDVMLFPARHLGRRYRSARSAISKAADRLERRGLAKRVYDPSGPFYRVTPSADCPYGLWQAQKPVGLALTPKGLLLAQSLSADVQTDPPSSADRRGVGRGPRSPS